MNQYPLWKYLLLVLSLVLGTLYALPNLYGEDPAVQISSSRAAHVTAATRDDVNALLSRQGITPIDSEFSDGRLLVRFANTQVQLKAKDAISSEFSSQDKDYVVALNLAPRTPAWLLALNALPMYLGLDLRGGVHFLMEVDMDAALNKAVDRYFDDIRTLMRDNKVRNLIIDDIRARGDERPGVEIRSREQESVAEARKIIAKEYATLQFKESEREGQYVLQALIGPQEELEIKRFAVKQNITTLRRRVNELGVAEPVIQQQGVDRIVVQLPGVQDTARAKDILGATATLEYRAQDLEHDVQGAIEGRVPAGSKLYKDRDGRPILLKRQVIVTGDQITDATSGLDQSSGSPAVFVTLDGKGAKLMDKFTKENVGKPMAVVFIEKKVETVIGSDGKPTKKRETREEVINVATIRERFSRRFQTTGLDSTEEAHNLALLLRAGALAAPVEIVEERTVGPSLGQENISQGQRSVIFSFILVMGFMAFYYRGFGMVANLALAANVVLILAILSMLQATLTLPGIAGIVLTVGMAVDANVLINERIREELAAGNTPQASIHAGYERAFATIADSNITTLIAALMLFMFGTGPIKGFAVVLSVGILTSMFTAIMLTRGVVNLAVGGRRVSKLSI